MDGAGPDEAGNGSGRQVVGVDGLQLSVQDFPGAEPVCIFLHGFAEAGFVWTDVARVASQGLRTIVPDIRGHGRSGWDPRGDYSLARCTLDLQALIVRLGCRRFVLVGHSMGGAIALNLAAARPPGLAGLVLVDWAAEMRRQDIAVVLGNATAGHRGFATPEAYVAALTAVRPLARPERLSLYADGNLRRDPDGGYWPRWDPAVSRGPAAFASTAAAWEALAALRTTWLLVRGRASSVLAPDVAQAMLASAPNGRLALVDRAGHGVMTDNPVALTAELQAFIREVVARP